MSERGAKADINKLSDAAAHLEEGLLARVVGQDRAVHQFVEAEEVGKRLG